MAQSPRIGGKSKWWCFTWNNYPDNAVQRIREYLEPISIFGLYQPEIGETGTKHLQGAFCLAGKEGRTMAGLKARIFGSTSIHLETKSLRSTTEQWVDYCRKESTRDSTASFGCREFGSFAALPAHGKQGSRTDLSTFCARLAEGQTLRACTEQDPGTFVKYHRGFAALSAVQCAPRMYDGAFHAPSVHWFWGPAGSGKTRLAYEEGSKGNESSDADPSRIFWKQPDTKWWDGYEQEPVLIMDDYRGSWFSVSYLLRLLDGYPFQVEIKGGSIAFNTGIIYITCPHPPEVVYANLKDADEGKYKQIQRRITEIREFKGERVIPDMFVTGFKPN